MCCFFYLQNSPVYLNLSPEKKLAQVLNTSYQIQFLKF